MAKSFHLAFTHTRPTTPNICFDISPITPCDFLQLSATSLVGIRGRAASNHTITLRDGNGNVVGVTMSDKYGSFIETLNLQREGIHTITASATSSGGRVSDPSEPVTVRVDTLAPKVNGTASCELISDFDNGSGTGPFTTSSQVAVVQVSFVSNEKGAAFLRNANADSQSNEFVVNANDDFTQNITTNLQLGPNLLAVILRDDARNERVLCQREVNFIFNINPLSMRVAEASDTGFSAFDGVTSDNTPQIDGLAEPESFVDVMSGNSSVGTTTVNELGHWTLVTKALDEGLNTLIAQSTSKDGAMIATSPPLQVIVDTLEPTANSTSSVTTLNKRNIAAALDCSIVPIFDTGVSDADGITDVPTANLRV